MKRNFRTLAFCAIISLVIAINSLGFTTLAKADETTEPTYHGKSLENVESFREYCLENGYNLDDIFLNEEASDIYIALYLSALEEEVISYISDDILRMGMPTIAPLWVGSNDFTSPNTNTHQAIVGAAITEIQKLYPSFFLKNSSSHYITRLYADYPDAEETGLYEGHFYNPVTGASFTGSTTKNAKVNFTYHYNLAKQYYASNKTRSFEELGKALHYLEDIGTPAHTGNISLATAAAQALTTHPDYENYANGRTASLISSTLSLFGFEPNYNYFATTSTDSIAHNLAVFSSALYCTGDSSKYEWSVSNAIPKTLEYVMGVMYKFINEVSHTSCNYSYVFVNSTTHRATCNTCGNVALESHTFIINLKGEYSCKYCGYVSGGGGDIGMDHPRNED